MKQWNPYLLVFFLFILLFSAPSTTFCQDDTAVPHDARCSVCGMMVAKYPVWVTRLTTPRGELFFDGVKDMMAYYHNPAMYGGQAGENFFNIFVRDYYSQKWIDGTRAYYVTGSDVLGPMGHEFIPFETMDAAHSFEKDHHGKNILLFEDISADMVMAMKKGHMKKKKMQQ